MGISYNTSVVRDGLVFYYDMANTQKSWKGKPTTNLYADGDYSSGTLHPVRGGTWSIVQDPRNTSKKVLKVLPSASYQYHGRDITAVVSSLYSFRVDVYASPDCDLTIFRLHGEQAASGVSVGYDFTKKGTWQTLKFDGKSATTTNIRILAYALTSFTTGYLLVSNMQTELGSFATPFVNGTRSNTQAVLDLTGQNTITASSVTYGNDGNFSFDGSSNYMSTNSAISAKTVMVWCKLSTSAGGSYSLYGPSANSEDNWLGINANKPYAFATETGDVNNFAIAGTTTLNTSSAAHIACTVDTNTLKLFTNGVEEASTTKAFTIGPWNSTAAIGRRSTLSQLYFPGTIYSLSVYNRVLSSSEVLNNFNAQRDRYGI